MNKYTDSLPLPPADGQLPPFDQLSPDELNAEAMQLAAAVEAKLGVIRAETSYTPTSDTQASHAALDKEMGDQFGVSRTTWWRIRVGKLAYHTNDKRLKYQKLRHKMHAFVTGTSKPEAPTDHTTVTPDTEKMPNTKNVQINFRVPPDVAREFRIAAVKSNQKQSAFLAHLLDGHSTAPTNGATAPDDQAIATQLEQWLDRVKSIENRMDQLEAEWKHKLRRTHVRHDAKNDAKKDAKAKKEIDALKKSHEEALAAVNDRLDSLAKHNKQLQTAWWRRWI
jgi:hypothetical protein